MTDTVDVVVKMPVELLKKMAADHEFIWNDSILTSAVMLSAISSDILQSYEQELEDSGFEGCDGFFNGLLEKSA